MNILGSISVIKNFMGNAGRNTCNNYLYTALKDAIKCMESRIPKKPTFEHMLGNWEGRFRCPVCGKVILHDCRDTGNTFCERCGQALNWSDDEP